ncbi:MAG TPA: TonB family protein, partial [Polyangia bacterium]
MDRNFAAAAPLALLALAATLAAGCLAATVPRARPAVEVDGLVEIDAPARAALGAAEAEWLEAVHDEIHGDWSMDVIPGLITNDLRYYDLRLEATVEITLEPSGKITEVRLARASGIEYLDRRAEALFANLGALPPPPEVLLSDDEVVRLRWRLARDQRGCAPGGAAVVRIVDPLDVAVGRLLRTGRHVRAAARLIEAVDEGTVPEPLARALTSDVLDATADREPDLDVRFTAVFALAENGDRRAVPKLRQLLKFANPESARAAARLATLGAREAIADLEAAVARNHPALNAAAIDALRALGRPDAADVLVPALRSREPRARLA